MLSLPPPASLLLGKITIQTYLRRFFFQHYFHIIILYSGMLRGHRVLEFRDVLLFDNKLLWVSAIKTVIFMAISSGNRHEDNTSNELSIVATTINQRPTQ